MTLTALLLVLSQSPSAESQQQYARATQLITARQFGEATVILNTLAPAHPRWAELYAARCSAQIGLSRPDTAAADCKYALSLNPVLYVALYGLATAEARLGQNQPAAQHFREYAAAPVGPGVDENLRTAALNQAMALEAPQGLPPPPPPPPPSGAPAAPAEQPSGGQQWTFNINPRVAPHRGPRGGRRLERESNQFECSSNLDCGAGSWCKDRGDGVKVCMDSGGHGDFCQNNLDCGSGGWCKDRGDGMKVCMSHGSRGDFCQNNLDCGSGLWCKDRGDGIKKCM